MNDIDRLKYCYTIIDQFPNLPKARNAKLLIRDIKEQMALEYESLIGYNPFEDDPTISPITVAEILEEYKAEIA